MRTLQARTSAHLIRRYIDYGWTRIVKRRPISTDFFQALFGSCQAEHAKMFLNCPQFFVVCFVTFMPLRISPQSFAVSLQIRVGHFFRSHKLVMLFRRNRDSVLA